MDLTVRAELCRFRASGWCGRDLGAFAPHSTIAEEQWLRKR